MRILFIDDCQDTRLAAERMFAQARFECATVETSAEAIAACESQEFDCVVADQHLPESMPGVELIRLLLAKHPDMPCVVMTGEPLTQEMIDANHVDSYVLKGHSDSWENLIRKVVGLVELRDGLRHLKAQQRAEA